MTPKEAEDKFGKRMWKRMQKTGWLNGITMTILPEGECNIPESDIDRAYRAANGEEIHPLDWD